MKIKGPALLGIISSLLVVPFACADYIGSVNIKDMGYDLGYFTIPDVPGGNSGGFHDDGSLQYQVKVSPNSGSWVELSIAGTLLGDGITWATSNPGIGIQYRFESTSSGAFEPENSETPPSYRMNLKHSGRIAGSFFHIRYRLVRLLETVPPGQITTLPQVTLLAHNPDGDGPSLISGIVLSKITSQLKPAACTIDAPVEVKLPDLYGSALVNGAQGVTDVSTVALTDCPGAINGIKYNLTAVYGTRMAADGVLNVATGEGFASNVYVQVQKGDGSALEVNNELSLSNYNGSGDYDLPPFKVAYYIEDADTVTAGKVQSALEVKVSYN